MAKNLVLRMWPDFGLFGPDLGRYFSFQNIWLCQSQDVMVSYHNVQYQKKTNDPILRKLSNGWTDRPTDRQTDQSNFIGHCSTNIQHPKTEKFYALISDNTWKASVGAHFGKFLVTKIFKTKLFQNPSFSAILNLYAAVTSYKKEKRFMQWH